jgi:hypothetical protein
MREAVVSDKASVKQRGLFLGANICSAREHGIFAESVTYFHFHFQPLAGPME